MPLVCGIYGYEFTRSFDAAGVHFEPRLKTLREAEAAAKAFDRYNLTGVAVADQFPGDLLFRLEAVLSFVEHLDVIVTEPIPMADSDLFAKLPAVLHTSRRHNGGGAVVGQDTFFPSSRATFVQKAVARLDDQTYCDRTGYRMLFFKTTETFRQRKPFLEVSYFLLFSALETYARRSLNDHTTREVAIPITRQLQKLGFRAFQYSPAEPERSMDTYARLRNALFHDSKFEVHRKVGGVVKTYKLESYFAPFLILLNLVVLRASDFDDGHINWDAWTDRQLFK